MAVCRLPPPSVVSDLGEMGSVHDIAGQGITVPHNNVGELFIAGVCNCAGAGHMVGISYNEALLALSGTAASPSCVYGLHFIYTAIHSNTTWFQGLPPRPPSSPPHSKRQAGLLPPPNNSWCHTWKEHWKWLRGHN